MSTRRRAVIFVAALAVAALTARLGVWQLDRAAQKEALQAAVEQRGQLSALTDRALPVSAASAEPKLHRPVVLQGEWVQRATVYLENRQMNGVPGFFVVTPLRLQGSGDAVLVQRGWVPRDMQDRSRVPDLPLPGGVVSLVGTLVPPPSKLYDFAGGSAGAIRQNLDLAEFARETGLALRPFSVQQSPTPANAHDGLSRQWPRPAVDIHKHLGYAFQWFALCALTAGLYVWFQLVRPRLRPRA